MSLFHVLVGLIIVVVLFGRMSAFFTRKPEDEARIRLEYGGISNRGGPYSKVIGIEPWGIFIRTFAMGGMGSGKIFRKYKVVIEKLNGERTTRVVAISAGFDGTMIETPSFRGIPLPF